MFRRFVVAAIVATTLGVPITLAQPAAAAVPTFTWTGLDAALGNAQWSRGANWAGGVSPPAGTPINLVVDQPPPCTDLTCNFSTIDYGGIILNDITVDNGGSLLLGGILGATPTLTGTISVTDGGWLGLNGVNLTGTSTTWTVDDGDLSVTGQGGTHVAVTVANGSAVSFNVQVISLSVTGTDPSAAPAANGTVALNSGSSPMLLSHVAATATSGATHNGPVLTDTVDLSIDYTIQPRINLFDYTVTGAVALDPATTILEWGGELPTFFPGLPPSYDLSHLRATGSLDLGSALLSIRLKQCVSVGTTLVVAESAPGALTGTLRQPGPNGPTALSEGAIVVAPSGACPAPTFLRIHYDVAAGQVTATVVQRPTITVATSHTPTVPGAPVTFTATVVPAPSGGTVSFTDNGAVISGCAARPVAPATGQATCTTSYAAPGNHVITASYSGATTVPPAGPSPGIAQVVVPAPTATITSPSGLSFVGTTIQGTASDAGGLGLLGVVLYYKSLTGGPSGAVLTTCATCGAGQTGSTWSFTPSPGSVPGIYAFVAQAFDVAGNAGPASNVVYQIILPALV